MLIALLTCMSAIALAYDWEAIGKIPWYLIPLIVVCPLYPALLALSLRTGNRGILAGIATVPAATFGLLALVFYPLYMLERGFDWLDFGQIFWVLAYAIPAFWLSFQVKPIGIWIGSLFSLACLGTLFATKSYGYLGIAELPQHMQITLLIVGCVGTLTLLFVLQSGVLKNNALLNRSK